MARCALQRVQRGLVEDLGDQAHVLVDQDLLAVADRDSRRLLAAVLQRVEAEVGELGDFLAGAQTPKTPHASWGPLSLGSRGRGSAGHHLVPQPHRIRQLPAVPALAGTREKVGRERYTLSLAMESPKPTGNMSIGGWSDFAGATRSMIVDLIISNLFNVCAVVGAVLLFAAVGSPLIWLGAALAVASLIILGWLVRRDMSRRRALLSTYQAPRIVVLVAVAAGYIARRPGDVAWIWAATGLAIFAIISEPTVRLLLTKATPVAVQLPGFPAVPRPPFNPTFVALAAVAEAAVGVVLALLGAPGWCYLLIVILGTMSAVIMVGYAIRAVSISRNSAIGVRKALQQYQPEFCVYYAARSGARYQLGMWLPYLERLNRRFIVITRYPHTVAEISDLTSAPVLVPKLKSSNGRLWHLVVDSLKAAFYVQNHQANVDMLRFPRLTHIWLNHGDSDKAANYSARHAAFDKVFVSGQQGVERYAEHGVRIRPDQFAIVGRPQIERIETHDEPLPLGAPRTVLYAPTWHGGKPNTNYSSLLLGSKIVTRCWPAARQ